MCATDGQSEETKLRQALIGAFRSCENLVPYFTGAVDRYIYQCKLEADQQVENEVTDYDDKQSIHTAINNAYTSNMQGYPNSLQGQLLNCGNDRRVFTVDVADQAIKYCQQLQNLSNSLINHVYTSTAIDQSCGC